MRHLSFLTLACAGLGIASAGPGNRQAADLLAQLPVRFEAAPQGRFAARGVHYRADVSSRDIRTVAGGKIVALEFAGARNTALEPAGRLAARVNVLHGNDRSKWQGNVASFDRLVARGIYPGIDIAYYGAAGELEYDLIVHPGADPARVRMNVKGARAQIDPAGNLVAGAIHKQPASYQLDAAGKRVAIASRFVRNADGSFRFATGEYDRTKDLIIDPQLTASAYLAGSSADVAIGVGHDNAGYVYVAGNTYSSDLNVTSDAFQSAIKGDMELFVARIDPRQPAGSQVIYFTYAGGGLADQMYGMAVDGAGTVYMTGSTSSIDFPLGNAAKATINGTQDAFVLLLNPSQAGANAMYYGTYLGGSLIDTGNAIAVGKGGRIGVIGTTNSTDLAAGGGFQTGLKGNSDAFVSVIDPNQSGASTLLFQSYLGGTNWDNGGGIAAAADGTFWVTGGTLSGDFPLMGGAIQPYYGWGGDAWVAQIDPNLGGNALLYSSYLGGSDIEEATAISVDALGRILVTGYTLSADFPVTANAAQATLKTAGSSFPFANAFVYVMQKVNGANRAVYSTYLGGSGGDEGYAIAGDSAGNIYVGGMTKSKDFPLTSGAMQRSLVGGPAGFITRLNPARAALDYSSYVTSPGQQAVYGIDIDNQGIWWVAGFTTSTLLESMGGDTRTTDRGNTDAFVFGIKQ